MKKTMSVMLLLLLILALAACGTEKVPATQAPTEAMTEASAEEPTAAPTEAPTAAPTAAPTEAPTEPAAAFDPYWAGPEQEMPIPQPPINLNGSGCLVNIGEDMIMIHAEGEAMEGVTEDAIIAYCAQLKEAGFTNILREEPYQNEYEEAKYAFIANTDEDLYLELDYGQGGGTADTGSDIIIVVVFP